MSRRGTVMDESRELLTILALAVGSSAGNASLNCGFGTAVLPGRDCPTFFDAVGDFSAPALTWGEAISSTRADCLCRARSFCAVSRARAHAATYASFACKSVCTTVVFNRAGVSSSTSTSGPEQQYIPATMCGGGSCWGDSVARRFSRASL